MIPRHQEREFKLQLAARVKLRHEKTSENMIDILLDVYSAFKQQGMDTIILGRDGLFASEDAFYQFLYHHKEAISGLLEEMAENGQNSTFLEFDDLIGSGERERERGLAREMIPDAAVKSADDHEFIVRALRALIQECGLKITEAIEARIQRYAKAIRAGKE